MNRERLTDISGRVAPDEMLAICFSAERGFGVQILADVAVGQCLHRFEGVIGPEISQHSLQIAPGQHIAHTSYVGFLSHGCDPNCALDMESRELVALRTIGEGEWLTIDYSATEDELYHQFACTCGSPRCRGWIMGQKDRIDAKGTSFLARRAPTADAA